MAPSRVEMNGDQVAATGSSYKATEFAKDAFMSLLNNGTLSIPQAIKDTSRQIKFTSSPLLESPVFPCPFRQTEAVAVLKAFESCAAAAIADIRNGRQLRNINVNLDKCARYLMSGYLCTIDGMDKTHPDVKKGLKNTDLHQAQSNIYRLFSTGLYATKRPDEYYHLHGSLEASTALGMIGLPPLNSEITEYRQAIDHVEDRMRRFTVEELEEKNQVNKQAGVKAYKREDVLKTEYGKVFDEPIWECEDIERETLPAPFPPRAPSSKRILEGLKVIEMCRVIAGPSAARILAEYGAHVLKVTSPALPDVPFFQIEGNSGKHTTDLNLKIPADREKFEVLLADADVLVDGYRHGALERLGYGISKVREIAKQRGKGIVYVSENCFGYGMYAERPGWQQIADSVSGVAWEQGRFMGLNEPIIPPFPMSDYGTGLMGAVTALIALYRRATEGGSYHTKTALVKYDGLLFRLGVYPEQMQKELRKRFAGDFFDMRHEEHTDVISKACLNTMRAVVPSFFENKEEYLEKWWSAAYNAEVEVVRQVANIEGVETGYQRGSRPNGSDPPTWDDWEVVKPLA